MISRTPPLASQRITIRSAVWIILRGCECVCDCMDPIGRHAASGLSLLLASIRCFRSSAAQREREQAFRRASRSQMSHRGADYTDEFQKGGASVGPNP